MEVYKAKLSTRYFQNATVEVIASPRVTVASFLEGARVQFRAHYVREMGRMGMDKLFPYIIPDFLDMLSKVHIHGVGSGVPLSPDTILAADPAGGEKIVWLCTGGHVEAEPRPTEGEGRPAAPAKPAESAGAAYPGGVAPSAPVEKDDSLPPADAGASSSKTRDPGDAV